MASSEGKVTLEFQHRISTVLKTIDGDTQGFAVRVLPDTVQTIVGRLLGFDCPESRRPASDYEIGKAAEAYNLAVAFLNGPGALWCRRELKRDSFGRELVDVWHVIDGIETHLGEALYDAGLATRWPVKWRHIYTDAGQRLADASALYNPEMLAHEHQH